jgi:hypothetical protein
MRERDAITFPADGALAWPLGAGTPGAVKRRLLAAADETIE